MTKAAQPGRLIGIDIPGLTSLSANKRIDWRINQMVQPKLDSVIDALRDYQSQGDSWKVADALFKMVPSGDAGLEEIIGVAEREHVLGKFKLNTLRQYRDTANRWPTANRLPGISFTVHREVMSATDEKGNPLSIEEKVKMLERLIKSQKGADKVTAVIARDAVRVRRGGAATGSHKAAPANASAAPTVAPSFDVLADIKKGASQLMDAIDGDKASEAQLDKIIAGLTKALSRANAHKTALARKRNAPAKQAPAKAVPEAKPANGNGTPAARARRGNMRDF